MPFYGISRSLGSRPVAGSKKAGPHSGTPANMKTPNPPCPPLQKGGVCLVQSMILATGDSDSQFETSPFIKGGPRGICSIAEGNDN
jgi:hypothetical protein